MFVGIFISCQEVFEPDVEELDPFLVVEASITTLPGIHSVYLRNSWSVKQDNSFRSVSNAIVYVTDDKNHRQYFEPNAEGVYQTDSASNFSAEVGRWYRLTVVLSDGTTFRSSPQTVVECPEISSLSCEYSQETVLTVNSYGDSKEVPVDGLNVIGETNGVLSAHNYYFYKFQGYEEHESWFINGDDAFALYNHRPLGGVYSTLALGNADEFGNFEMRKQKILFIEAERMFNYVPPVPDSLLSIMSGTTFHGLLFRLEQHSLTIDAYEFWSDAQAQLEAGGKLFDPVTPQLYGNMECVSDSLSKVIGIFTVSDVKVKYSYFYINSSNWTRTQDLDSYPELFIDSLRNGPPADWIFPRRY